MPAAEIITIGTELLLGETVDTNTRYIARALRDEGLDLYRTSTIGDNVERIAEIIQEAMTRSEVIITTGGLGPTVDDPSRKAVALALGVEIEFRPDLWVQIQERFERHGRTPTENNKRQAYVPQGAIAIENTVGTAPAFIGITEKHAIISLPGVPREMEHIMQTKVLPYLKERFDLTGVIKSRVLHTSGVGESQIDERIDDLERLTNPTVGLAAHAGQVDVRITAKAETEDQADGKIQVVERQLRKRLRSWIYGADEDTLEGVALDVLSSYGWELCVVEANLGGRLIRRLANAEGPFSGGEVLTTSPTPEDLPATVRDFCQAHGAQAGLGIILTPGKTKQTLYIALLTPDEERQVIRTYGGPPKLAPLWAVNLSLDIIRKL
ncbi:MAG: competence/damage-inducible protein A [Chloroflexi bacterium]|nr:competence/damage-inducible protein A [Chloroflexota bacterium]